MPRGFWYAGGPCDRVSIKPGSAFSKGDILTLDSNSSLSRVNPYALGSGLSLVFGVATCDSNDSVSDLCSAIIPGPDTLFWSNGTVSQTLVRGEVSGVSFVAASPGRYFVDESTTSKVVVIVRGTVELDQSVASKALVKFKYSAGELMLS